MREDMLSSQERNFLHRIYKRYAKKDRASGRAPTFDDIQKANSTLSLTEFANFAKDYKVIPDMFNVSELRQIFAEANTSRVSDPDRASLSFPEFASAIIFCAEQCFYEDERPLGSMVGWLQSSSATGRTNVRKPRSPKQQRQPSRTPSQSAQSSASFSRSPESAAAMSPSPEPAVELIVEHFASPEIPTDIESLDWFVKAVAALADHEFEFSSTASARSASQMLAMYQLLVVKYREVCWQECQAQDRKRANYDEITKGAQQLQQFVKVLSGQNEELKKDKTSLEQVVQELQKELEDAQKELEDARSSNAVADSSTALGDLQQQLDKSNKQFLQLTDAHSELQESEAALSAKYNVAQKELLTHELKQSGASDPNAALLAAASEATAAAAQQQLESTTMDKDVAEALNRDLQKQLAGSIEAQQALQELGQEQSLELTQLEELNREQAANLVSLEAEAKAAIEEMQALADAAAQAKAAAQEMRENPEVVKEVVEVKDGAADAQLLQCQRDLLGLRAELDQVARHSSVLDEEFATCKIEKRKAELECEMAHTAKQRTEQELKFEIEHLRTELSKEQQRVDQQHGAKAQPRDDSQAPPATTSQLSQAHAETTAQFKVVDELEQRLADILKQTQLDLRAQEAKVDSMSKQLQKAKDELKTSSMLAASRAQEIEALKEQVQEERQALDKALADVSQAEKACSLMMYEASGKAQQLEDKLSTEASDWLLKAEELKSEHDAELQQLANTKHQDALNQKELETLQRLAEARKMEVEQLRSIMEADSKESLNKMQKLQQQKEDALSQAQREATDRLLELQQQKEDALSQAQKEATDRLLELQQQKEEAQKEATDRLLELQQKEEVTSQLSQAHAEATAQFRVVDEALGQSKVNLASSRREANDLRVQKEELETARVLDQSKVNLASSRREELEVQLDAEKRAKQLMMAQLESNKQLLQQEEQSVYGARTRLEAERATISSQEAELKRRSTALDNDKLALETERLALVEEIAQEMATVQKEKTRIENREEELKQTQRNIQEMKDDAVRELEARERALNDKQDSKIAELEDHVNALEGRASVLEPLRAELEQADQQADTLRCQLEAAEAELAQLQQEGASELNELAGLAGHLLESLDRKVVDVPDESQEANHQDQVDDPTQPSKTWRKWASQRRNSLHAESGSSTQKDVSSTPDQSTGSGAESKFEGVPSSLIRSALESATNELGKAPEQDKKAEQLLFDVEVLQTQLSDAWEQLAEASQKEVELQAQLQQLEQETARLNQSVLMCENCSQLEAMIESLSEQLQTEKAAGGAANAEVSQLLQAVQSAELAASQRERDVGVLRAKLDDSRAHQSAPAQPGMKPKKKKQEALSNKLFLHYASQTDSFNGTFSEMDDMNAQMDLTEFVRFCRDFELTDQFSVSKLKVIFNEANRGGHADDRRGVLNEPEFGVAIDMMMSQIAQQGKVPSQKLLELHEAIRNDDENNDTTQDNEPVHASDGKSAEQVAELEDALQQSNTAVEGLVRQLEQSKSTQKTKLQAMYRALEEMEQKSNADQEQVSRLQAQLDALQGNVGGDAF